MKGDDPGLVWDGFKGKIGKGKYIKWVWSYGVR